MIEPGAIACGHDITAAAAEEILRDGGNAIDAIIAAQFAGLDSGALDLARYSKVAPSQNEVDDHSGDRAILSSPATSTFSPPSACLK